MSGVSPARARRARWRPTASVPERARTELIELIELTSTLQAGCAPALADIPTLRSQPYVALRVAAGVWVDVERTWRCLHPSGPLSPASRASAGLPHRIEFFDLDGGMNATTLTDHDLAGGTAAIVGDPVGQRDRQVMLRATGLVAAVIAAAQDVMDDCDVTAAMLGRAFAGQARLRPCRARHASTTVPISLAA